jgi:type IV fimbrial biogenesis protein FimT
MKRREKGLTLIELMVTLAIAIVALAIGIPAFNALSARDVSAATVNALVTALQQARAEAISQGKFTAVCSKANKATSNTCGTDETWRMGWLVFVEPASANGVRDDAAGDFVIKGFPAVRADTSITAPEGVSAVRFNALGEAVDPVTLTVRVYRSATHDAANCVRGVDVVVTAVGQVRSEVRTICQ